MAEEQNKFLNQGHLDHDVSCAQAQEVQQESSEALLHGKPGAEQQRGQRQNHNGGNHAHSQQLEKQRKRVVDLGIRRIARLGDVFPQIAGLNRIEEEWPVVVDGGNIEWVIRKEFVRIRTQKKLRKRIVLFLARHIQTLQVAVSTARLRA